MKHSTLLLCLLLVTACTSSTKSSPAFATPSTSATKSVSSGEPGTVLVGAGDIASCDDLRGAEATAKLLDNIPGTVFAAGDLAYPISTRINHVANDDEACSEPVELTESQAGLFS
jgi:hypothetical protein